MRFTVLNIAYPLAPVGPDAVGGAEQILSHLDRALVAAGHQSLVLAREDSVVSGELIPTTRIEGELTTKAHLAVHEEVRGKIAHLLETRSIDLIHLHGVDCFHYLPETDTPVLVTLHLPPDWYPPELFQLDRRTVYLHCVSRSQQAGCPASATLLPPIENGVDLGQLFPRGRKRNFAIALGRICPEKGFHLALDAAQRAGVPMVLAGELFPYPSHRDYFQTRILPRLDERRRFVGPVGLHRKRRLLAAAKCLLLPSLARETSSLVAMEALACGTPVIAFPSGAIPELIEPGRTGWIVENETQMAQAIGKVDAIDPRACREAAEGRFSAERMCREYLDRYRDLIARSSERLELRGEPESIGFSSKTFSVKPLTTAEELDGLSGEWWDLWHRCPGTTPFQSPAWLLPWIKHFSPEKIWALALREDGRLASVAAFYLVPKGEGSKLLLLGTGNTDYLDILAAPQSAEESARAILRHLMDHSLDWDECDLIQLPTSSPLLLPGAIGEWTGSRQPRGNCPTLFLDEGKSLKECLPDRQWRKLAYYRRRAERTGRLTVHRADAANFEPLFEEFLTLHKARWETRNLPGVLADSTVQEFHREAAAELLKRGLLRLTVLHLDGLAIAAFYGFCHDGRTYYYLSGFDPRFHLLSPGMLVVGEAIGSALGEGCREFDFLQGGEAYKYAWGARDRPTFALSFERKPVLQQE